MKTINYQVAAQALPEFFDALLIDRLKGQVTAKMDQFYVIEVFYPSEKEHLIGKLKVAHAKDMAPLASKHMLYYLGGVLIGEYLEQGFKKLLGDQNKRNNLKK